MSSSRGFGGIVRSGADQSGGGAGVLTLDNGLTLTGTNGQLGGPLIIPTDIPLNGNPLSVSSAFGGFVMFLDDTFGAALASFGFDAGTLNPSWIQFEQNVAFMNVGNFQAMNVDGFNGVFEFGDVLGGGNGTELRIEDNNSRGVIRTALGEMLFLDQSAGIYGMGDFTGITNGMVFQIESPSSEAKIQSNLGLHLYINSLGGLYFFGDDNISSGLAMNTSAGQYAISDQGNPFLQLDTTSLSFTLGDMNGVGNGTLARIVDGSGILQIQNTAMNAAVEINGLTGFSGIQTPVTSITVEGGIVTNVS